MENKMKNFNDPFEHEVQFDIYSNKNKYSFQEKNIIQANKNLNLNLTHNGNRAIIFENVINNNDHMGTANLNKINDYSNFNKSDHRNETNNKFIKEYHSNLNLYGLSIQNNKNSFRVALSSLEMRIYNIYDKFKNNNNKILNKIEIIEYSKENDQLRNICSLPTEFPQSKLSWCPAKDSFNLLASASDIIRLSKFNELNNKLTFLCDLNNADKNTSGPLTSMDWNKINTNLIGVSSVDTTCTIWDLEKQEIKTQVLAHDAEVIDITFGNTENSFISSGADGSIRLFDLRCLETCSVMFEMEDLSIINRISWNLNNNNYIACSVKDKNSIFIIDRRILNVPVTTLNYHTNLINAITWAPGSYSHVCSVGDDKNALIWDTQMMENENQDPILCYKSEKEIVNCAWSETYEDWIAINSGNMLKMLKVI